VINDLTNKNIFSDIFWGSLLLFAVSTLVVILQLCFRASPCLADSAIILDPLGNFRDLNEAYFYFNPEQKGKSLDSINTLDRYDDLGETPLTTALWNNDPKEVKDLLDRGANPNIAQAKGLLPIQIAINTNNMENLNLLLTRGANVDEKSLSWASNNAEMLELIKRYLPPKEAKATKPANEKALPTLINLNFEDEAQALKEILAWEEENNRYYPSITAAVMFRRPTKVITELLNEKSDINEQHPILGTPLIQAIEQNCALGYINFLLEKGADPNLVSNSYKRWPLYEAVGSGRADLVKSLFAHGAKLSVSGARESDDPFYSALSDGKLNMVKTFLEEGANPKQNVRDSRGKNFSPLIVVIKHTNEPNDKLLTLLLKNGADPNATDEYRCNALAILEWSEENIPAAIALLKGGVSPKDPCIRKKQGESLYHYAIREESKELFAAIREAKLSPNVLNDSGESPLFLAVSYGYPWFTKALIDSGALVNKSVSDGSQSGSFSSGESGNDDLLALAVKIGDNLEVVQILLDAGVDINVKTNSYDQFTALHLCVEENRPDMAKAILNKKANTQVRDVQKRTPLHLAVLYHRMEIIKLLLKAGADVEAKDEEGKTPLDYAAEEPNGEELLAALRRR
ncbi:MAG: ankyrin repeat domain-containing protein, partial [Deltaproteobacteria bacterium]|nr:ankyrin repeat domain-containing protein [Deltaproteobacteria bacterium]